MLIGDGGVGIDGEWEGREKRGLITSFLRCLPKGKEAKRSTPGAASNQPTGTKEHDNIRLRNDEEGKRETKNRVTKGECRSLFTMRGVDCHEALETLTKEGGGGRS